MQQIDYAVEKYRKQILEAERFFWTHPETGFREWESSSYLAEKCKALGYTLTYAEQIPGFYTTLDTGRPGPTVLLFGELDAVLCPDHPEADPTTGAVHACGHHAQCAALLGIAAALRSPEICDRLAGRIRLCAVPAEEPLETEFRAQLKKEGKISHFGGKREFLSRGYFDGVDLAFMVHLSTHNAVGLGAVGSLSKQVIYHGVASHAGGAPERGKNALYAAVCGINGLNAIREALVGNTRVHAILTRGGESVGTIPAYSELTCYLRADTLEEMAGTNQRVTTALCGGALSLGCTLTTADTLTFAPLRNDASMIDVAREAATAIGIDCMYTGAMTTGSTDLGDLSCLMPVVHPFVCGAAGETHGKDYRIADPSAACITNAKWQLAMLHLLLQNGGARASAISKAYQPLFSTKEDFLHAVQMLAVQKDRIHYTEVGASIDLA